MKFWEIEDASKSDYQHVFISGTIDHPYRLPIVDCEKCGVMVGPVYEVTLPFECPPALRKIALLRDHDVRITVEEFKALRKKAAAKLPKRAVARLVPQARLQPGFLDIPSFPQDDFLWHGVSSLAVSEMVKRELKKLKVAGIEFYPCTPRRIGRRPAKSSPRIPKSGEPEDIMREFKSGKADIPNYFQLIITAESAYPPGSEPKSFCDACGEPLGVDWGIIGNAWKNLSPEVIASIAGGLDIFRIRHHGGIYVTDRLKSALEAMGATNVCFTPFPRLPIPKPSRKPMKS